MHVNRRDFTLIELMVVISIVIVVMFCGAQFGQYSASQSRCVSGLKQIGIAFQNYYAAHPPRLAE